jgi:hypothetical protein
LNRKATSISDLRFSAEQIGRLYPVLVDKDGEIIDGHHRLRADPHWPVMKLENVKTDEQRLIARLITNVCRRMVSASEKKEILKKLYYFYLEKGIEPSKIVRKITERTGMSYRWVMMYLPEKLKQRPGVGGPRKGSKFGANNFSNCEVANLATTQHEGGLLTPRKEPVVTIKKYANTGFVGLLLEKRTYMKFEEFAESNDVETETVITNAFLLALDLIKRGYATGSPHPFQY